jgi:hypothetical protein
LLVEKLEAAQEKWAVLGFLAVLGMTIWKWCRVGASCSPTLAAEAAAKVGHPHFS